LDVTVTEKAERTLYVKWVRSGIGFTRRQRKAIRSLGLRRLHHVVERSDTPQVRGQVASIPHLVEIVNAPPKAVPWSAIPEYTVHPKVVTPAEEPVAAVSPVEETVVGMESPLKGVASLPAPAAEAPAKPANATKASKPVAAKSKATKAAKEPEKKKAKAPVKPAKKTKSKK
jgi:large subunit ribosomal protein L30